MNGRATGHLLAHLLLSLGTRLLALAGAMASTALLWALVYYPTYFLLIELAARTESGPSEVKGITLIVMLFVITNGILARIRDPYGLAAKVRLDDAFDTAGQAQARRLAAQRWRDENYRVTGGDPSYPVPGALLGATSGGSFGGWIIGLLMIALGPHHYAGNDRSVSTGPSEVASGSEKLDAGLR